MDYDPKTDEQIDKEGLIPDRTKCHAEVKEAATHIGKESGKESIKLVLHVYHEDQTKQIWVFLTPKFAKLWKHAICSMIGQTEYEAGHIGPDSFLDKSCMVEIGLDEYQGKPKNIITDFFPPSGEKRMRQPGEDSDDNGSLPF